MVSLAETQKREFTADEQTSFDALNTEIERFDTDILAAEKREKFATRNAASKPENKVEGGEEKEMRNFSLTKLVREAKGNDTSKVTGLEKEILDECEKEGRAIGADPNSIYLSSKVLSVVQKREMVVGTPGAGGYFVPTEKIGFFDALYAKTVLAELGVNLLTGLSANSDLPGFSVPVSTSWNGETDTISPADATVVNRALRPHALAGATDISRQLMVQTNDSVDAYILGSIMKSMKVSLENAVINGDGTNKPLGILSTPNIQTVAIGANGGNLTPAFVQALITKVLQANADEGSCKFLTNFKVRSFLKQLPIDSGSGAMVMSYMKYFQGEANLIDSFETICTSNVPSTLTKGSTGTNLSALIFGDFSQVVIGQFGGVSLSIDNVSAAVVRAQKVALTVTQFVDSAVKQPTAIGAILDATA